MSCIREFLSKFAVMKIALFGNAYLTESLTCIERLLATLEREGVAVVVEQDFMHFLRQHIMPMPAVQGTFAAGGRVQADVAMSLGGDGTFLRTAQAVAWQGIPIVGINAGHLGYLTTADIGQAQRVATALLSHDYRIEQRTMLALSCGDSGRPVCGTPYALNEIAILRQETSSMIQVEVSVDGEPLTTYGGDGLLVCTPTGSTAYNLSVGGPILAPLSHSLVLSPISPHSLTMRPVVIGDDVTIRATTRTRARVYQVSVDGQTMTLKSGSSLQIERAPFTANVIVLPGTSFASTLRTKLMWGR